MTLSYLFGQMLLTNWQQCAITALGLFGPFLVVSVASVVSVVFTVDIFVIDARAARLLAASLIII